MMHTIYIHKDKVIALMVIITFGCVVSFYWLSQQIRQNLANRLKVIHILQTAEKEFHEKASKSQHDMSIMRHINKSYQLQRQSHATRQTNNKIIIDKNNVIDLKVLILTFGGSEFTISLDPLNSYDDVIYWHEPMRIWERLNKNWRGNDLNIYHNDPLFNFSYNNNVKASKNKYESSIDFYNELFTCSFTKKILTFLTEAVRLCPDYLILSKSIAEVLNCHVDVKKSLVNCQSPSKNTLRSLHKLCKNRRKNVVIKESEERTVELSVFQNKLKVSGNLKVLHLVRDPRAVFFEFSRQGRVTNNAFIDDIWDKGDYTCHKFLVDLKHGKKCLEATGKSVYSLHRYEDFTEYTEIVSTLFHRASTSTEKKGTEEERLSFLGDRERLEKLKWREQINSAFSSTIENICWKIFEELDYKYLSINVKEGESYKPRD